MTSSKSKRTGGEAAWLRSLPADVHDRLSEALTVVELNDHVV
jgi:hypothetical protein